MYEISCATFETRINDLLDARRDPAADETLIRHADHCAACQAVFADYLALDDSLSNIVWDAKTLERLAAPTAAVRPYRLWWSAALAATLLIAFNSIFGSSPWGDNNATASKQVSAKAQKPPIVAVPQSDRQPQQRLGNDSIAKPLVGSGLTPVSWNELSQRLQPVLNPYYQFSAELPGIRPIQSSLNLTIDWVQEKILKQSAGRQQKQGFGQSVRRNKPIA